MSFSLIDAAIVTVCLSVCLLAGYLVKKYVGTVADYLVARRGMGLYVGIASLVSSEIGIITYMYFAELGYLTGFSAFINGVIAGVVLLAIGLSGFVIKKLRDLEVMTIPEYFERRYGKGVRVLAGVLTAVGGILNFGIFPSVEARFLNTLLGISGTHLALTTCLLIVAALIYTALGGMISLLLTNYLQYVLLSAGTLAVTGLLLYKVGWLSCVHAVGASMGVSGFDPLTNVNYGWAFVFWQMLIWTAVLTSMQPVAMRLFAAKDSGVGRLIFSWTAVLFLARAVLPIFWGIAALAYLGGGIASLDAMPTLLVKLLPIGLKGLVLAGLLAGSMATYSGYLLAYSSIVSQDVILKLWRRPWSEEQKVRLNQTTVVALALFTLAWSLLYKVQGPTYFYLCITTNIFFGGTLASLVFGLYSRHANAVGAYLSFILGAASTLAFFVAGLRADISGFASFGSAFAGMIIGLLLTPRSKSRQGEVGRAATG